MTSQLSPDQLARAAALGATLASIDRSFHLALPCSSPFTSFQRLGLDRDTIWFVLGVPSDPSREAAFVAEVSRSYRDPRHWPVQDGRPHLDD